MLVKIGRFYLHFKYISWAKGERTDCISLRVHYAKVKKYYTKNEYGDIVGCFCAALRDRARIMKEHQKQKQISTYKKAFKNNLSTRTLGVTRCVDKRRVGNPAFYAAYMGSGEEMKRKSFSVDKHGEERAFQKARDYRAEMEEEWRVRQGGLKLPS